MHSRRLLIVLLALPVLAWPARATSDGQDQTRHDRPLVVDPVYKEIAEKTGGRVYDMRNPEDMKAFQEDMIRGPQREARRERWQQRFRHVSENTKLAVYAALKWLAYVAWCWVGLRRAGVIAKRGLKAAGWGTFRVGLGLVVGYGLFLAFVFFGRSFTGSFGSYITLYLSVYIPVRWVEWSVMVHAMGVPRPNANWRLGGIAVSFGADLLQMTLFGSLIPTGRFLC